MDTSSVATALTAILAPALPYLLKGGEGIASGALQKIGADTWDKAKSIWQRLRPKVEDKPAALEAVQDIAKSPENPKYHTVFEVQIEKILEQDQELLEELQRLLESTEQKVAYTAELHGAGAIAQGAGAVAAGEGGVAIGGNVHGGVNVSKHTDDEKS